VQQVPAAVVTGERVDLIDDDRPHVGEEALTIAQHPVYTWNTWYIDGMSEMPSESVRDVRSHLADVVDRADRDDEPTVITRRGKPVAAVVPISILRRYQEWEEQEINRIVDERMSSRAAAVPMEDVIKETLARGE
jgi:prevent-host-death family protein